MKKIPYYLLLALTSIAYIGCEGIDTQNVTEVIHEITGPSHTSQEKLVEVETAKAEAEAAKQAAEKAKAEAEAAKQAAATAEAAVKAEAEAKAQAAIKLAEAAKAKLAEAEAKTQAAELALKETEAEVSQIGLVGGTGGNAFSDKIPDKKKNRNIAAVKVRSGWGLDAIQVIYAKKKYRNGGTGGGENVFILKEDEYITKITGEAGTYVGTIQFHTNKGRKSDEYGTAGGQQWSGTDFTLQAPANKQISGFRGRSGSYIDAIGIKVSSKDSLKSSEKHGKLKGGSGGNKFSDKAPNNARVAGVRVRSGSGLDAIQILYAKEKHRHGGTGGGENVFILKEDEYITKITGKAGTYVGSIQFHTNKGKSDEYGTAQGQWSGTEFKLEAPKGSKVVGFKGRSGRYIDAIGIKTRKK